MLPAGSEAQSHCSRVTDMALALLRTSKWDSQLTPKIITEGFDMKRKEVMICI